MNEHEQEVRILDQFTRQAGPFAERHKADHDLLQAMIEVSGVGAKDHVLDVACGPGIVACAFGRVARQVTGLDLVPAMLEQARGLQARRGLANVSWKQGRATEIPFSDGEFDAVVSRFAFHHYLDPAAALAEMARVCRPGGTLVIGDVAPSRAAREAYDALEKSRDPSHTRALTDGEFETLGRAAGLTLLRQVRHPLLTDLEGLLASSFPGPGGAHKVRAAVEADIRAGQDALGLGAHRRDGAVYFYFPVLLLAWTK